MTGLLYIFVLISGIVGLSSMMFMSAPLTAENASLLTARAAIATAFVVIPYFLARAIEQVHTQLLTNKSTANRQLHFENASDTQVVQDSEPFFEYFFAPGCAQEWKKDAGIQDER